MRLWSHLVESSEQGQGQHTEICPTQGGASRQGLPPSPARRSPEAEQGLADDFFLPCHQCKYICLSAQLTVIRGKRGRVTVDGERKIKIATQRQIGEQQYSHEEEMGKRE